MRFPHCQKRTVVSLRFEVWTARRQSAPLPPRLPATPPRSAAYFSCLINLTTSPWSGNRPSLFFENTSCPSYSTSKTPPLDAIRSDSIPKFFFKSSAKLAAFGL
jgi:hypothetical protein